MREEHGVEAAHIADKGREPLLALPVGEVAGAVAAEGVIVYLSADAASVGGPPVAVGVVDGDHQPSEALQLVKVRDSADA